MEEPTKPPEPASSTTGGASRWVVPQEMPLLESLQVAIKSSEAGERETCDAVFALLLHSADLVEAKRLLQSTSNTLRSLGQGTSFRAAELGVAALEAWTQGEQYLSALRARMKGTNDSLRSAGEMLQRYELLRADIVVIASFPFSSESQPRPQVWQRLREFGSLQAELIEFFGTVVSTLGAELQECRLRIEVAQRACNDLLRALATLLPR